MAQTATVQIEMPEMGESVTEGIVLEWHVAEGDFVNEGDTVVEISTDKVDAEVPAPVAGTITRLIAQVDEEVPVGAPLAEIGSGEGEGRARSGGSCSPQAGPEHEAAGRGLSPSRAARGGEANGSTEERCRATPVARRVAEAKGVDLGGPQTAAAPGAKVTKEDVLAGRQRRRRAAPTAGEARAAAGAGGDARRGDEREPGGSHRHLLSHDRRRHAGRQAKGAQRGCSKSGG